MEDIKLLIQRSPEDKRDYIAEDMLEVGVSIPAYLNLTLNMPAVRDQGSQGSCAAMAAAAIKEWEENKDVMYSGYMSPQFIYNLRSNAPGEGMYTRDLMKILNKTGVVKEADYPYGSTAAISTSLKTQAANYVIQSYAMVTTVAGLKTALVANGPCLVSVPVYNYGTRMWKQGTGELFKGGHAMAVVGYNNTGFLIRNSWGVNWGVMGYTVFPYEDWGEHWEFWTAVDAKSKPSYLKSASDSALKKWKQETFAR